MSKDLWKTIARLRRAQPRNPDTMAVCDALEHSTQVIRKLEGMVRDMAARQTMTVLQKGGPFDKKAYMRAYMREWRAKAKARKTD